MYHLHINMANAQITSLAKKNIQNSEVNAWQRSNLRKNIKYLMYK